jgi:hypothetical protein
MEKYVARSVLRMVAEVLRPVRPIGDFAIFAEDASNFRCKAAKGLNEGKAARLVPDHRQPAEFGTDYESLYSSRTHSQVRQMQDQPAIAPIVFVSGIADLIVFDLKVADAHIAKKCLDLSGGGCGLVRTTGLVWCWMAAYASAPGISTLPRSAIGVRQIIVRTDVHHHEGVEGDTEASRLGVANRVDDTLI